MANDPIPTTDQQVANRTGQTAPVPLPAALQPSTKGVSQFGEHQDLPAAFNGWDKLFAKQGQEPAGWKNLVSESGHVPMLTPDGSQSGDVPLHRAKEARASGFHLAVPMVAPNRQPGWVPYHRISDAIASGFQHVSDATANAAEELSNLTSVGLLPAFLKTPRGKEINDQWNQAIQENIHNPETRLNTLVGMVQPGGLEGGEPELGQRIPRPKVGGEPAHIPPERTTGAFNDAQIKAGGAIPGGIQKGDPEIDLKDIVMFHDPATGSSLGLHPEQVSAENVRAQMRTSRAAYLKAKPEESEIVQPGHPLHIPEPRPVEANVPTEPAAKPATVAEGADAFNVANNRPPIEASTKPHDPEFAARVADAYDALQHNPNDPAAQAAYGAMKNDIRAQWDYANQKMGIKFEPWETSFDYKKSFSELGKEKAQPYANSKEMMDDVNKNHHLYFFQGGTMAKDHPLADIDPQTGYSYNDMLRAVHDLFGHAAHGFQFGPKGEENAYLVHRQMFSPEAIPALTTETRAQNSWFNYGQHLRNAEGKVPAKGEPGFVPTSERPFAENKAALLPEQFQQTTPPPKPEISEQAKPGNKEVPTAGTPTVEPSASPAEPELRGIAKLDAPLDATHANSKPIEYPRDKKFTNNTAAGMILPDGRIINARSAHIDTAKAAGFDNIDDFLKDSGAIRVIYGQGYGGGGNIGLEMHQPPTDAQIEVAAHNIQRAKKAGVGDGGVIWDFVSPDGKYQSGHGSIGAFQRDVEQWRASQTPGHWGVTSDLLADRPDGGAVDPKTGKEDPKGFGVEIYPEARQRLDHAPTPDDLKSYYEDHKDIFDQHPDLRLGWYQDPEKGWELNIGANTQSREGAEWAARKLDQKAIYDIEKGAVIPTGGQNEKTNFGRYNLDQRMKDASGESFKEMQKEFPSQAETRSMIRAGQVAKTWWQDSRDTMSLLANSDPEAAHDLGQFLTAVSSNKGNDLALRLGLKIHNDWVDAGKPTAPGAISDIAEKAQEDLARSEEGQTLFGPVEPGKAQRMMPVDKLMLERYVGGSSFYHPEDLRSAKIANMGLTMGGDPWAGVLDRHTGRTMAYGKELQPISKGYFAMKDWLRQAAISENMTLEEAQASNWVIGRLLSPDTSLTAPQIMEKIKSGDTLKAGETYADIILNNPKVKELARRVISQSGGTPDEVFADIRKITESKHPSLIEGSKNEASNPTLVRYIKRAVKGRAEGKIKP